MSYELRNPGATSDPVWSAVIAAGVSAAAAALGTYLLGLWPAIVALAVGGWQFLLASTQVSNWLLVLLVLAAIPTLLLAVAVLWNSIGGSSDDKTSWTNYTTDTFFGIRWRWRYVGNSIDQLHTFCPHCDYQVFPHDASPYQAVDRIAFTCDSCHRELGSFDERYPHLESKAERFIQQKLRNDSWRVDSGA